MTMLIAILLVGAGSYALRAVPFLLVDRISLSPRIEEALNHATAAAMTALIVGLVLHLGDSPTLSGAARWVGLGFGVIATAGRLSMVKIMAVGMLGAWLTALAMHL